MEKCSYKNCNKEGIFTNSYGNMYCEEHWKILKDYYV